MSISVLLEWTTALLEGPHHQAIVVLLLLTVILIWLDLNVFDVLLMVDFLFYVNAVPTKCRAEIS